MCNDLVLDNFIHLSLALRLHANSIPRNVQQTEILKDDPGLYSQRPNIYTKEYERDCCRRQTRKKRVAARHGLPERLVKLASHEGKPSSNEFKGSEHGRPPALFVCAWMSNYYPNIRRNLSPNPSGHRYRRKMRQTVGD